MDLGFTRGIVPRCDGDFGIENGTAKDIALISKVNSQFVLLLLIYLTIRICQFFQGKKHRKFA